MLRLLMAGMGGAVVSMVGVAFVIPRADEPLFAQLATVVLAFVGVPALILRVWRPRTAVENARKRGTLEVREVHAVAACQIAETEDEGLHFFLETAAGGTLFVSGQFLYDAINERIFPSEHMKISRDTRTGDVLAIESSGKLLRSGPPLPPFTPEEHAADEVPGNLAEFPDPPTVVLAGLGRTI